MLKKIIPFIKSRYAPRGARQTFSQYGEDVIILDILSKIGIKKPSYIDIGMHDPVFGNNTYLFYRQGGRGVLIEPNIAYCKIAKRKRSKDVVINAGVSSKIGVEDFYSFVRSTRSTFSKEQAKAWEASSGQKPKIQSIQVESLDILVEKYFPSTSPDIVSIDAEGLDTEILNSYSWIKRPKIFCIESDKNLNSIMENNGYVLKAQIMQNSIFVDKNI